MGIYQTEMRCGCIVQDYTYNYPFSSEIVESCLWHRLLLLFRFKPENFNFKRIDDQ